MNLDELRKEIDAIDQKMMDLFKQRMDVSLKIGNYKKENNLSIYDEKRERELLEKRRVLYGDEKTWPYYESFLTHLMHLSKAYQK